MADRVGVRADCSNASDGSLHCAGTGVSAKGIRTRAKQWLLDEDRLRWPIGDHFDLHAVFCVDSDNIPLRWLLGVYEETQLPKIRDYVGQRGERACDLPVRIHLPDIFCDLNVDHLSGTAEVQLSQASFSIVGAPRPKRSSRRRTTRRAN